jgi:hypothetical protein
MLLMVCGLFLARILSISAQTSSFEGFDASIRICRTTCSSEFFSRAALSP